jgi:predicted nucleotidyltransferase
VAPVPLDPALFSPDTREFIALLHRHAVRYLLVGGGAVIYYGFPRLTGDMDFFYDAGLENARRLYTALDEFWTGNIPTLGKPEELTEIGLILQFGIPPNRIDLINEIDGLTFAEAWPNRLTLTMPTAGQTVEVPMIGLEDLIRNKAASQRPKDIEDLKFLHRARTKSG